MLDDALLINLWSRFKRSEPFGRNSSNQVVFIFDKIYILQSEGGEMIKYCLLIEKYFLYLAQPSVHLSEQQKLGSEDVLLCSTLLVNQSRVLQF